MNLIKFISTPLSAVFCSTCTHWGGARVTKDGFSNTGENYTGSCKSTLNTLEYNKPEDKQMKANHADCKYWIAIEAAADSAS